MAATLIGQVRGYVFERETGICRCCRRRPAESMHELRSAGAMGSRVKATNPHNSIAVCGRLVGTDRSCHSFLQTHAITWSGDAEGVLTFEPRTETARRWMEAA